MEQGRITWPQLGMLMYLMVGATSVLIVPSVTAKYAHQDLWMTPFIGSVVGFVAIYMALRLYRYYPNQSIIQYGEHLLGKWIGGTANLVWLFFLWQNTGVILREYGEFIVGSVLLRTPQSVVSICLIFVCALAIRGGIEVLGKFALLITPLFLGFVIFIPLLLTPEMDVLQITPVLENGWKPVLKGSILPMEWFMEYVLVSFMLPYATGQQSPWRWLSLPIILMLGTMVLLNLTCLFVFGDLTSMYTFSVFNAAKYISLGNIIEHIEAIVMVLWIMGGFVQISSWYYILVIGTAQSFHIRDYRPLVFPIGILIVAMSLWIVNDLSEMTKLFATSGAVFAAVVQICYPALLLLIAWWKHKTGETKYRERPDSPSAT